MSLHSLINAFTAVQAPPPTPSPSAPETALPVDYRRAFAIVRQAARQALNRRARMLRVTGQAYTKAARHESALAQVGDDLMTLVRLVRAWAIGSYREVPWRSLLYGTAALLYLVNPFDAIPDMLGVIGLADDIAVISVVVRAIRRDLDAFLAWEQAGASTNGNALPPGETTTPSRLLATTAENL